MRQLTNYIACLSRSLVDVFKDSYYNTGINQLSSPAWTNLYELEMRNKVLRKYCKAIITIFTTL